VPLRSSDLARFKCSGCTQTPDVRLLKFIGTHFDGPASPQRVWRSIGSSPKSKRARDKETETERERERERDPRGMHLMHSHSELRPGSYRPAARRPANRGEISLRHGATRRGFVALNATRVHVGDTRKRLQLCRALCNSAGTGTPLTSDFVPASLARRC